MSLLDRSPNSQFFLRSANVVPGKPSGETAIAINKKFSASLLDLSDIYIAVTLRCFVLSCI